MHTVSHQSVRLQGMMMMTLMLRETGIILREIQEKTELQHMWHPTMSALPHLMIKQEDHFPIQLISQPNEEA